MNATVTPLWTKSFLLCLANNLFLFIFYFAQTTILPIYILKELGGSVTQAGLTLTLFMVSAILIRPFSGLIIEKLGQRRTLIISATMFCFIAFSYLFISNMTNLYILRLIHGVWFSILTTVCVPVVNQFISDSRRGEGMGYYAMSMNLGIVLGPLIGLSLIPYLSYTMVTAVLVAMIFIGYIFCFLIPVQEVKQPDSEAEKTKLGLSDFVERKSLTIALMAMMISFSYASIMSFIAPFASSIHLMQYAGLFFVVFAISMMSLRPITGKIYDLKGPQYVIYPAVLTFSLGLLVLSQIHTLTGFMLAAVLIGLGFGSAQPCLQTLAIQRAPKHRIGYATSTFYTCYDIGIAIGSLVVGMMITKQSFSFAFIICAALTALSLLYFKFVVQRTTVIA
ncbi:MFS transporter [Acinetobacter schindleri]|uniref:MFS transporter n=1 Tax=Acinetobacter TaxID=469 RepID=UPI000263DFF0|nr:MULTISPECIES: MFS transporter [Acinetobacter]EIM38105.1 major facilitator family transporter [Acinetobacter sp. HA]MCK8640952.1 MFS transporter [Acinetobacter schindleri]MEB5928529.1 MFS transporter [Acinetobacter schindleri]